MTRSPRLIYVRTLFLLFSPRRPYRSSRQAMLVLCFGRTINCIPFAVVGGRRDPAGVLPAVSSRPRKTVRWDLVEIAASRTEEDDRTFLCDNCFDGESIRQCERVLTLCPHTADHPRWVETHLRQVLQSVGGYHDALACFWSAGTRSLQ
jgi:hypothetical protein